MPDARAVLHVSLTEQPQFRRLVEFVREVEAHAQATDDFDLLSIVNHLDDDLLGMLNGDDK